jgi:hypothetical protein
MYRVDLYVDNIKIATGNFEIVDKPPDSGSQPQSGILAAKAGTIAEQQLLRSDLDLNRYCTSRGFNGVVNLDGTGYGWKCVPGIVGVDVDQLCKEQFGNAFRAVLISTPPGGKNDWRCQRIP